MQEYGVADDPGLGFEVTRVVEVGTLDDPEGEEDACKSNRNPL
jgi:hypothetical protein